MCVRVGERKRAKERVCVRICSVDIRVRCIYVLIQVEFTGVRYFCPPLLLCVSVCVCVCVSCVSVCVCERE